MPPPTGLLLASAIWQGTGGGAGHLRDRRPHPRSPDFGSQLADWAGAVRVLTLVDEINFLATGFRRRVTRRDLALFADVLDAMPRGREIAPDRDWGYLAASSCGPRGADLRHPDWRMPTFPIDWAVEVQARGWEAHDTRFRFLGHDLQQFGRSPLESRERHANGDLAMPRPRPSAATLRSSAARRSRSLCGSA